MKTTQKIVAAVFVLLLVLMSVVTFAAPAQGASVKVVSSKYDNLFVFKVDREFKNAKVEVYYSNGDLVAKRELSKRKMIINFCDVKSGLYTIKVTKENKVEEFNYVRK